jgi:hypothetical protein
LFVGDGGLAGATARGTKPTADGCWCVGGWIMVGLLRERLDRVWESAAGEEPGFGSGARWIGGASSRPRGRDLLSA